MAQIWQVAPDSHLVDEVLQVMDGESRGDPNAQNGIYIGLMQYGCDEYWTVERLKDPFQNLLAAKIMWDQDRWGPWAVKPRCGGCY